MGGKNIKHLQRKETRVFPQHRDHTLCFISTPGDITGDQARRAFIGWFAQKTHQVNANEYRVRSVEQQRTNRKE